MAIPEIWSDLHHNLEIDAQGAIRKVINLEAIHTSIDNILRTRKGERVMLPEFGAALQDMVFEPTNEQSMQMIADRIKKEINTWDDRVIIQTIQFIAQPDENTMIVKVAFQVKGYDDIFDHSTKLTGV